MSSDLTHVSFVLIPRFNMLTLTATIEPMRIANYLSADQLYRWDFRSPEPGEIQASNGLNIQCLSLDRGAGDDQLGTKPDIIVVCGSWGAEYYRSSLLFNWLRRLARHGTRLIAVELDLMLHLVAEQHGDQLAIEVANQMLHYPRRPAEGAQRFGAGGLYEEIHLDVRAAMSAIEGHIEEPISVTALCRHLDVSQRQLERLFRRDTGCTIVQFSQLLRLQYARVLLTSTRMAIREVSAACGFNSMSYFSLFFMKAFGKKPSEYRLAWPDNEPTPSWPGTLYAFIQKTREAAGGTIPSNHSRKATVTCH